MAVRRDRVEQGLVLAPPVPRFLIDRDLESACVQQKAVISRLGGAEPIGKALVLPSRAAAPSSGARMGRPRVEPTALSTQGKTSKANDCSARARQEPCSGYVTDLEAGAVPHSRRAPPQPQRSAAGSGRSPGQSAVRVLQTPRPDRRHWADRRRVAVAICHLPETFEY